MTYIYIWLTSFHFLKQNYFPHLLPHLLWFLYGCKRVKPYCKENIKNARKNPPKKWKDLKISTQLPKSQLPNKLWDVWDEDEWKVWKSSDCQPSQEEKGTTRFWCSNLSQHQFCMPSFVDFLCHSFLCFASTHITATLYLEFHYTSSSHCQKDWVRVIFQLNKIYKPPNWILFLFLSFVCRH
jgi:hypothetical protein